MRRRLFFLALLTFWTATHSKAAPTSQPTTAPAWLTKAPSAWPQMLLLNKVTQTAGGAGFSGSSSLARLPNGAVVLTTAGHLLDKSSAADFSKTFRSWLAMPTMKSSVGVPMTSVAMDVTQPLDLDVLILLPGVQQSSWPATVLPMRDEPLQLGETVYLIGIPTDDNSRQIPRKAVIAKIRADGTAEYTVDGTFVTTGNSGAPVIDLQGRLAGVNTGHLLSQTIPGHMQLVMADASEVLKRVRLPANMKPLVLTDHPRTAGPTSKPASVDSSAEIAAAKRLVLLQVKIEHGFGSTAKADLEALISDYPNTQAAKQAKQMLLELKK